jgi:CubicO group peptidase (beta-lactamase class C family)
MRQRSFVVAVGLVSALTLSLDAQQSEPRNDSRYVERLDAALQRFVVEDGVPGVAVGIVDEGQVVYANGFGLMDLSTGTRTVTRDTVFHLASITKTFVATAVMQLVERGRIALDAPVVKYLPYFRLSDPRYDAITIRQILTHTSGLPDVDNYAWDRPEYDTGALERYVRSLAPLTLRSGPGSTYAYSNLAFEVLGDVIAKASGRSFEDYVHAEILQPLRMTSSTLFYEGVPRQTWAAGHTKSEAGAVSVVPHYPYNRSHAPSSTLHSSASDMTRWMLAMLNGGELGGRRLVQKHSVDEMWSPTIDAREGRIGLAWLSLTVEGEQLVWHGGGDTGFRARLMLLPRRNSGVIVLANSDRVNTNRLAQTRYRPSWRASRVSCRPSLPTRRAPTAWSPPCWPRCLRASAPARARQWKCRCTKRWFRS